MEAPLVAPVATPAGEMLTEIFGAVSGEQRPCVIFYMDARGVRDELREMCARLAEPGYVVLLPDLYHRMGQQIGFPSETSTGTKEEVDTIIRHIHATSNEGAMADTAALLHWVDSQADFRIGSCGAVGYCMGGPFAFAAAGTFPDRIAAAASFYGVGCMSEKEDSPHRLADRITGKVYFGYAERDHLAPVAEMEPLRAYLTDLGVEHEVELYPGVDHGFAFPRRAAYDAQATERHWQALSDLFAQKLGRP
jgi:carboxymethylenebutenolidase